MMSGVSSPDSVSFRPDNVFDAPGVIFTSSSQLPCYRFAILWSAVNIASRRLSAFLTSLCFWPVCGTVANPAFRNGNLNLAAKSESAAISKLQVKMSYYLL